MAERNQSDWRTLCEAAATEPDSEKLADLVERIIKALGKVETDAHPTARAANHEARGLRHQNFPGVDLLG